MIVIGVDPGLSGAIGFLLNGSFLDVVDMPVLEKSGGVVKKEVDTVAFKHTIVSRMLPGENTYSILEKVSARPGQGVSSMFSLGDSYGCARSVLSNISNGFTTVTPQVWKKYYNISGDKSDSLELARLLFPSAPLKLKRHSDRAESLLIANYLWKTKYA